MLILENCRNCRKWNSNGGICYPDFEMYLKIGKELWCTLFEAIEDLYGGSNCQVK